MTWVNGPAVFSNNVLANQTSTGSSTGNCLLCVEDYSLDADDGRADAGDRATATCTTAPSASAPTWLVVWSDGAGVAGRVHDRSRPSRRPPARRRAASTSTGGAVVTADGTPTSAMPSAANAQPLPADIAALIGQASGSKHLGAWG